MAAVVVAAPRLTLLSLLPLLLLFTLGSFQVVHAALSKLTGLPVCSDEDFLPAVQTECEAQMEVIGPPLQLCRVPIPKGYGPRPAWPKCLWQIPSANIPKAALWESIKADQSWVIVNGDKLDLPRNGGSGAASDFLGQLPPEVDKASIRNVLDEGAGVCGMAAEMMATWDHRPTVLSYAPHDSHASQVQVCAERGLPAIIFSMARYQFPAPHSSFDLVTCKWCWHWIQSTSIGAWYMELDRVIKPGGYFAILAEIWSMTNFREQTDHWTGLMGWKRLTPYDTKAFAMFQKPMTDADAAAAPGAKPMSPCYHGDVRDPVFRKYHAPCRFPITPQITPPAVDQSHAEALNAIAMMIVDALGPDLINTTTNVLDANTQGGALAGALRVVLPNAWVLGVQPVKSSEYHHRGVGRAVNFRGSGNEAEIHPSVGMSTNRMNDTLSETFARGNVGIYHDWCYMFPTYPRAFDLIVLRDFEPHKNCGVTVLLELDRIIRPAGLLVFTGEATTPGKPPLGLAGMIDVAEVSALGWTLRPATKATPPGMVVFEKTGSGPL